MQDLIFNSRLIVEAFCESPETEPPPTPMITHLEKINFCKNLEHDVKKKENKNLNDLKK